MTSTEHTPAVLVLSDGRIFRGRGFGATGTALGEAVFTTAMTGYQETLTSPASHGQLLVATTPQIGNTGWNDEDSAARDGRIWAAGLIIRDLSRRVSNWRAERSLAEELAAQNIIGIHSVDTRTLVRHLREHGATPAGIFSGADAERSDAELREIVAGQSAAAGVDVSVAVTTAEPYTVAAAGQKQYTVVAYDLGIRSTTLRQFAARGIETVVVPAGTSLAEALQHRPDGIFLSEGPGDPAAADTTVALAREILSAGVPLFGSDFGHLVLGRALGRDTYKMAGGHHGLNVPVRNHLNDRVEITSQHHGFALAGAPGEEFNTDFGPAAVTHSCLSDDSVEGVALADGKAFSVQYHLESAADATEVNPLLERFAELMSAHSPNRQ